MAADSFYCVYAVACMQTLDTLSMEDQISCRANFDAKPKCVVSNIPKSVTEEAKRHTNLTSIHVKRDRNGDESNRKKSQQRAAPVQAEIPEHGAREDGERGTHRRPCEIITCIDGTNVSAQTVSGSAL
jgi:hypothetical protein